MVKQVTPEAVNEMINSEADVVIVDVLTRESYRKQHLPKALSIPMPDVTDVLPRIVAEKDHAIVVYCYNSDCQASPKAAQALEKAGYTNVMDLEVGIQGYKEAGFDVMTYTD